MSGKFERAEDFVTAATEKSTKKHAAMDLLMSSSFYGKPKAFFTQKDNEFFIVSYCALRLNSSFVQFISHPMLMYYPFCIVKSNITKSSSSRAGKNAGSKRRL